MTRRLFWFSAGVAAAPLAWGVAHVAYIAVDDWLTERRRLPRELAEVEDRLATLCEIVRSYASPLAARPPSDPKTLEVWGTQLLLAIEDAEHPEATR